MDTRKGAVWYVIVTRRLTISDSNSGNLNFTKAGRMKNEEKGRANVIRESETVDLDKIWLSNVRDRQQTHKSSALE